MLSADFCTTSLPQLLPLHVREGLVVIYVGGQLLYHHAPPAVAAAFERKPGCQPGLGGCCALKPGWLLVQEASPRQGAFGSTTFGTDLLVSGLSLQSRSSLDHAQGLNSLRSLQRQLQVNIICLAIAYWAVESAAVAVSMRMQLWAAVCTLQEERVALAAVCGRVGLQSCCPLPVLGKF